jgi:type IX secretion system PorP/SprF family membrane protein
MNHPFFQIIPARRSRQPVFWIALVWVMYGFGGSGRIMAQDPVFSQFHLTPLQLNPGLAGLSEDLRVAASYRNQFPGFNNAYRTYTVSADVFFPDEEIGAGLWLLSDDAGDGILKTVKGAGIFSYRLRLGRSTFLKTGIELGIVQSSLRWDRLTFGDQLDDVLGGTSPGGTPFPTEEIAPDKNQVIYPDIGIGGVVYGKSLYGGISVRHLNRPDPDFLSVNSALSPRLPMHWTVHAGGTWRILRQAFSRSWEKVTVSPAVLYARQGDLSQLNAGVTLEAGWVSAGIHYRHSGANADAAIGSIGLRTNNLRIGYSFDFTLSGLPANGGTHELGLVYHFNDGDTESRYNDCLQIFR